MPTTNMPVTENPTMNGQKLPHIRKMIASLIAGLRKSQSGKLPVTARGRALYTVDSFLNGKPVLPNHDGSRTPLRCTFAY